MAHVFTPEEEKLSKQVAAMHASTGCPDIGPREGFTGRNDPPRKAEPLLEDLPETLWQVAKPAVSLLALVALVAVCILFFRQVWFLILCGLFFYSLRAFR